MRGLPLGFLLLHAVAAQDLQELQKKASEFTLANGLHFIVLERHEAPVVSFHTRVNVGSMNDPAGKTGLAHMFEHLAFKGTESVGSRDWPEEKKALAAVEEAYDLMEAEMNKGIKADAARVDMLRIRVRQAADNAVRFAASADYSRIIQENGGVHLAALVAAGASEFSYSLPSNRAELWFRMESERLSRPVFREFYRERDALLEEYRQRESNPQVKALAEMLAAAFTAHPYRNPAGGWSSDIASLRRTEAQAFFDRHYVPGNVTVAIVGDVLTADAKRLAERYFGPIPARPLPRLPVTREPAQQGPKTVTLEMNGQPFTMVGYKRPSQYDEDDLPLELIRILLSEGRAGLLYNELVQEKLIAQQARATAVNPDGRFPNLFVFQLTPAPGRSLEDNQHALDELLQRLKSSPLDAQLLARAKARARAEHVRRMSGNRDLAALLARYAASGDWRQLFTTLDDVNRVKGEDVQRAAGRCFVATGRTTLNAVLPGQSNAPPPPKPAERKAGGSQ